MNTADTPGADPRPRAGAGILAVAPPFDGLPEAVRIDLAAASGQQSYAAGELILDAFRTPPEHVGVLLSGEVELWVEGERNGDLASHDDADQRLGVGAVFGLDATLTGRAIGPRVVAAEPATVLLMPAAKVASALAKVAPGNAGRRALLVTPPYLRVDDLLTTQPLLLDGGLTVQQAAVAMNASGGQGLVAVRRADGVLGVVSDRSLREMVLAAGLPASVPIDQVLVTDLPSVASGASAAEALALLLDRGASGVLVLDQDGHLLGCVDRGDLIASTTAPGVAVNERLLRAQSVDEVQVLAHDLPRLMTDLLAGGLASAGVLSVYTTLVDTVIRRMLALVFEAHPDLDPDGFSWLSLGSNGRRETTISSDVDCAAVFPDGTSQAEIDRYRAVFSEVTAGLAGAGLSADGHGATAAHQNFSRTAADWRHSAETWLADPLANQGATMASLLLDARPIHGGTHLTPVTELFAGLRGHLGTLRMLLEESLAKRAKVHRLETLFLHRHPFDLKQHALLPIVNLARFAALAVGSQALPTADRLRAASGSSILPDEQARTLIEVFGVLQSIRLRQQLRQVGNDRPATDIVDLGQVSAIDQSIILRAVREIAAVQKRVFNISRYQDPEDWLRPAASAGEQA